MYRLGLFSLLLLGCTEVRYDLPDWWQDPDPPPPATGLVLITNSGDDTVSFLDPVTLELVFDMPVGRVPPEREGPHHAAASPDGSAYFIGISNFVPGAGSGPHGSHGTGSVPGYLLKYDSATHELVGSALVDRSPGDVRITPDGKYVLQTHFDLKRIVEVMEIDGPIEDMYATVAITDAATMQVVAKVEVCPAPHGLFIEADSKSAWVACWASDEIARVSLEAPYPVERFHVGTAPISPGAPTYGPYAIMKHPSDGSLWVSCINSRDLRIFDPAAGTFRPSIDPQGAPFFATFTADGNRAYLPNQGGPSSMTVHDGATGAVLRTLLFGAECVAPHAVLLLPGEQKAVVVCEGNHQGPGTVLRVNVAADPPIIEAMTTVGVFPDDAVLIGAP